MSSPDYDRLVDEVERLTRERDEARAELDAERGRLIARIQTLWALLREVEWAGPSEVCPSCGASRLGYEESGTIRTIDTHHVGCRLAALIK